MPHKTTQPKYPPRFSSFAFGDLGWTPTLLDPNSLIIR